MARSLAAALFCVLLAGPAGAQPSSPPPAAPGVDRSLTSAVSYVPLPTISTGVINRAQRSSGTLIVDVGLDVPNEALRRRAASSGPRMRDALRTALATYANVYYRSGSAPDPDAMARLMQAAVDRTLGGAGARLLVANVVFQARS